MNRKIAGLDIGTTGCKVTVFDQEGNYLDKAYQTYPVKGAFPNMRWMRKSF